MQTRARVLILLPCTGFLFDDLTFNLTHNPNLVLWIILKSTKQNLKTIVGLNSPSMLDSSHLSSFYYFFFLLSNPAQQATGLLLMTTDVFSNTAQQQPAYLSCLPPLYLLAGELKIEICPKHQVFVKLMWPRNRPSIAASAEGIYLLWSVAMNMYEGGKRRECC